MGANKRAAQMRRQRQAEKRRQRSATYRPSRPGPVWLKGDLESQITYGMLALYYGQEDEGAQILAEVKRKHPGHPMASFLTTYASMLRGDYSRSVMQAWRRSAQRARSFPQPLWDGAPAAHSDETLLLWHPNWGFGDTFQWIRLVAAAKQQFGGRVVLEVRPGLSRLLQGLPGADLIIEPEPEGQFNWQMPHDLLPTVIDITPQIMALI
jgi:hypothetical protein